MPHALLVDDSRTARAVLKHMLSKESYDVEAVESAEQGLDFLRDGSTDVIFMDHMMPGMDGFQAVKRLKAGDSTRHIPIVMYTSKEGDVYRGQASALGATAILSKPATQAQLQQVLKEVAASVVNASRADARAEQKEATQGKASDAGTVQEAINSETVNTAVVDEAKTSTDSHARATEKAVVEVVEKVSAAAPAERKPNTEPDAPSADVVKATEIRVEESARRSSWLMPWLLIAGVLAAILAGAKYSEVSKAHEAATRANQQLLDSVVAVANQAGRFDAGELGFSGARVDLLRTVLEAAQTAGFNGTVLLKAHAGQFCMSQAPSGELYVANDQLAIDECASVGMNGRVAVRQTETLSSRFRELLDVHPALHNQDLTVQVEGVGDAQPLVSYPDANTVTTAGDWNSVARANNRVEFQLIPLKRK